MRDKFKFSEDLSKQEWVEPWLIQRLKKAYGNDSVLTTISAAFAFGGGLRDGGLSKEAMQLLSQLWSFDYMGSSEFEWGAVPAALHAMAKFREADLLDCFTVTLKGPKPEYRMVGRKPHAFRSAYKSEEHMTQAKAFVVCHHNHKEQVCQVLVDLTRGTSHHSDLRLKESDRAWEAIFAAEEPDVIGGLCLDSAWLYLSSKAETAITGFRKLLELPEPTEVDLTKRTMTPKKGKR